MRPLSLVVRAGAARPAQRDDMFPCSGRSGEQRVEGSDPQSRGSDSRAFSETDRASRRLRKAPVPRYPRPPEPGALSLASRERLTVAERSNAVAAGLQFTPLEAALRSQAAGSRSAARPKLAA